MAIIKCRECSADISDQASSCPKCGFVAHARVQEIEQTGKQYKAQFLMASGLVIFSMLVGMVGGAGNSAIAIWLGILGFAAGLIWFVGIRIMAWWHHG